MLKGKKLLLLLLRKVAASLGWPDEALHDELIRGFRITGLQDASGVFGLDPRPASGTKEDLLKQSKHLRPALWAKIKGAPLDSLGRELWDITYAEYLDKSWLEEPRTFSQLEQMMPEGWVPTRRFPVVQHDKLRPIDDLTECGNADRCAKAVLDLFGFTWAKDKDEAFSPCTDLLGVRLATSTSGPAAVTLSNKPSRVADLRSAIDKVVSDGVLKPREAASVFGRLQFAETQLLGRAGRLAMADIRWIERAHRDVKLDDLDKNVFRMLASRVASGKPRVLTASTSAARALVFTDGACEGEEGNQQLTIGGVLYFWTGRAWFTRWFSGFVPAELASAWRAAGKRHLIGPTELYAVIVARHVWSRFLDNTRSMFFIDHAGVLSSCIKGTSRASEWRKLLLTFEKIDSSSPSLTW